MNRACRILPGSDDVGRCSSPGVYQLRRLIEAHFVGGNEFESFEGALSSV